MLLNNPNCILKSAQMFPLFLVEIIWAMDEWSFVSWTYAYRDENLVNQSCGFQQNLVEEEFDQLLC